MSYFREFEGFREVEGRLIREDEDDLWFGEDEDDLEDPETGDDDIDLLDYADPEEEEI